MSLYIAASSEKRNRATVTHSVWGRPYVCLSVSESRHCSWLKPLERAVLKTSV